MFCHVHSIFRFVGISSYIVADEDLYLPIPGGYLDPVVYCICDVIFKVHHAS